MYERRGLLKNLPRSGITENVNKPSGQNYVAHNTHLGYEMYQHLCDAYQEMSLHGLAPHYVFRSADALKEFTEEHIDTGLLKALLPQATGIGYILGFIESTAIHAEAREASEWMD